MKPIALITGGQRGIGFGIAEALVGAGFHVALASNIAPDAPETREALAKLGTAAHYYQHDLQNFDQVDTLLNHIEAELGLITTLVSNAGVSAKLRGDMLDLLPEHFDFVMNVNLKGSFFLAQAVAQRMLAQRTQTYCSITFITSVSAAMVSIERAEYCISKAAASMMTQLFAVRLAPHGIGVFELRPGIIETDMTVGVKDKYTARIEAGLVPAQRWGQPADIGQIIPPLATGQMAFANGAVIPVDGGLSISRL